MFTSQGSRSLLEGLTYKEKVLAEQSNSLKHATATLDIRTHPWRDVGSAVGYAEFGLRRIWAWIP